MRIISFITDPRVVDRICAIGKASAARRRILSNPVLRRTPGPALGDNAQRRRETIRMPARRPSDRGVPEPLRNLDQPMRNSGQAANGRAFCRSKTDFGPAIRCLPRVIPGFPGFPLFPPRFPLCSRIMLISPCSNAPTCRHGERIPHTFISDPSYDLTSRRKHLPINSWAGTI
jgi:hypothetical protein